ncbi:hypothetical protein PAXINDRAFT_6227 [Paxillus involutus ATCC 200175]|nr:hypothetical protein PAXINDRAFT_6227 [Paxillus involutus ATCC 200175]
MATVKQTLVHFASELALPPVDRPKARSLYPKVAQSKGSSEQRSSYDLFWRWGKLSSVPNPTSECNSIKRNKVPELVLEGNDDRVILFNASKTQQDGYPTLTLTGSMTLAHAVDQTAANNLRTRPFMSGTSSDGAGNSACLAGFLQDSKELGAVDGGRTSFCRVV